MRLNILNVVRKKVIIMTNDTFNGVPFLHYQETGIYLDIKHLGKWAEEVNAKFEEYELHLKELKEHYENEISNLHEELMFLRNEINRGIYYE